MNEEEIIEHVEYSLLNPCFNNGNSTIINNEDLKGLLDLYNKEKEKNKNSISKDKIRKDLEICQKVYEEEMKPYQTEYGLNITGLSKKEKEQLVNKRNCLITQMKTYEMLLEE